MIINRNHTADQFTPSEVKYLLDNDRVHFFTNPAYGDEKFPYIAFVEPTHGLRVIDAWFVAADGSKRDPYPHPVRVADTNHLDFGVWKFRHALIDWAAPKEGTFIFADANGYTKMFGIGADATEAWKDAQLRLEKVWPKIPDIYKPIIACNGSKYESISMKFGAKFLPATQMLKSHHGYSTDQTYRAAAALSSDSQAASKAQEVLLGETTPDVFCKWLEKRLKSLDADFKQDAKFVDWTEVLVELDIDPDKTYERRRRTEVPLAQGELSGINQEVKGREVPAEVLSVLQQCSVDGQQLYMPPGRMPPKLYKQVDEVLKALGGKWVGRKVQAHVFEECEDLAALMDTVVSTKKYLSPKDFGYFWTGDDLADQVIKAADIQPGMKILEPSAGRGALALRAAEATGDINLVTVVELMHTNANALRNSGFCAVNETDFLSLDPVPIFDRVVMNPPFNGLADIKHIQHAMRFLKPDGRLVAICSPSWEFREKHSGAEEFRDLMRECEATVDVVPAGAFKHAGTNIETRVLTMDAENFPWNREVQRSRQAESV